MKKTIILTSAIIAALISVGLADQGLFLPAFMVSGYNFFLLWANTRKQKSPGHKSGADRKRALKPIYTYSKVRDGFRQAYNERWYA